MMDTTNTFQDLLKKIEEQRLENSWAHEQFDHSDLTKRRNSE